MSEDGQIHIENDRISDSPAKDVDHSSANRVSVGPIVSRSPQKDEWPIPQEATSVLDQSGPSSSFGSLKEIENLNNAHGDESEQVKFDGLDLVYSVDCAEIQNRWLNNYIPPLDHEVKITFLT